MNQISHKLWIGKILDCRDGMDKERVAVYRQEPNYYCNGDTYDYVGWLALRKCHMRPGDMYFPAKDLQDYFSPLLGPVEDRPIPLEIIYRIRKKQ